MSKEILVAFKALEAEKGIPSEKLMAVLEDALLSAYKKTPNAVQFARVELDPVSGDFRVYELLIPSHLEEKLFEEAISKAEIEAETKDKKDRKPVEVKIDLDNLDEYAEEIKQKDVTPDNFGHIAIQTAKQVIFQRIREVEQDIVYKEYHNRIGDLTMWTVEQTDARYTLIQLQKNVEALLPKSEQVDRERYTHGMRIKVVIAKVSSSTKGPGVVVSRSNPNLISELFKLEVPEVADGLVEITNVARKAGYQSKISVVSQAEGVDPIGACVGPRGSRVRMIVSELKGEKIDIVLRDKEPAKFVAKALSPARVREVIADDEHKQATVVVPDDQLALAIGKEGLNVRLASQLTGWKINIQSETEYNESESESSIQDESEDASSHCRAALSTGRHCPNVALPDSRYCGLPHHQKLEKEENPELKGEGTSGVENATDS